MTPVSESISFRGLPTRFLLLVLVASLSLFAVACGGDDDNGGEPDGTTDVTEDSGDDMGGTVEPEGVQRTYRFTDLELTEPNVSVLPVLNPVVGASLALPPEDPEAVHVLMQFDAWDLMVDPITLELAAGAGVTSDMGASFGFDTQTDVVVVPASYAENGEGDMTISNTEPTSLEFPIKVGDMTSFLPLKDLQLDSCYGTGPSCSGSDETELYGQLTGAIIETEADELEVELPTGTRTFGSILRDPMGECMSNEDCTGGRECGRVEAGLCERVPELMVDGEAAFALEGQFVASEVAFAE